MSLFFVLIYILYHLSFSEGVIIGQKRLKFMLQKRNLITLKNIKKLGHASRVILEKQTGNKYVLIMNKLR